MTECGPVQYSTGNYTPEKCVCPPETDTQTAPRTHGIALLNDPVPPVALAPYLEHLISGRAFEPVSIDNPVVIIVNPAAGNGKGSRIAAGLHTELSKAMASGRITVDGDIIYHETVADPSKRANAIVNVVKGFNPKRPPYVISIGGDGTAADVMEAVIKASNGEYRPYVIPGPGGTANDLRRNQGLSADPSKLLFQLPKAVPAEFDIVYATINGGEPELLLHSQSTGASGNFFKAVNDRLAHLKSVGRLRPISGPVSYLVKAPGAVLGTQPFQVRVYLDGIEVPIKANTIGEVVTMVNTTSLGAISRVPQPMEGARVHFIPINDSLPGLARYSPGLAPIGDSVLRSTRFYLGDQSVVAPGKTIRFLDDVVDVKPGQRLRVEFYNLDGNPTAVRGVLNGDVHPKAIRVMELEATGERMPTLAMSDSALMIQRGKATPGTIWEKAIERSSRVLDKSGRYGFFGTIAAYEIYKDMSGLNAEQRVYSDLATMSVIFGADLYAAVTYGTNPFLYEMPMVIPFYELGYHVTDGVTNFVGRTVNSRRLQRGSTTHKVISVGGGFASVHTAVRVVGVSTWKAAGLQIARAVGTVGEGIENFCVGAFNFAKNIRFFTPVIILPGYNEYLNRHNRYRIPTS